MPSYEWWAARYAFGFAPPVIELRAISYATSSNHTPNANTPVSAHVANAAYESPSRSDIFEFP